MADTITLIAQDEEGERIIQAFAKETGLEGEESAGRHIFDVDPDEHDVPVIQTLDEIDEDWTEHVALEDPA